MKERRNENKTLVGSRYKNQPSPCNDEHFSQRGGKAELQNLGEVKVQ